MSTAGSLIVVSNGNKMGDEVAMKAHAPYDHCHPKFCPFLDNKCADSMEPNFQINAVLVTKPEKNTSQYQPAWKNQEKDLYILCISYASHRPERESTHSFKEIHTKLITRC